MQRIDIDKIKAHIERNKMRYILSSAVAGTIAFALITRYVMRRGFTPRMYIRPKSKENVYTFKMQGESPSSSFLLGDDNTVNNTITNTTNTYIGNGNTMSKIVSCNETGEWFRSQAEACRGYGISQTNLSHHLNKGTPIVGSNLTFKREGIAA